MQVKKYFYNIIYNTIQLLVGSSEKQHFSSSELPLECLWERTLAISHPVPVSKLSKNFLLKKKKWGYSVLCYFRTKWMFSPCKQAWISLWFLLLSLISILKRIYTSLHFIIIIRACITLPGLRIVKFYKLPAGSCLDR